MSAFRTGYLYSLSPIHCGGEGDIGNVLEIAREAHTDFPYIPGSSLRGSIRQEVDNLDPQAAAANTLFGQALTPDGQMGVHQVWFGDARLLWVPMRSLSFEGGKHVFSWVSCHSLINNHAMVTGVSLVPLPEEPVGDRPGNYSVADTRVRVSPFPAGLQSALSEPAAHWPDSLKGAILSNWERNRIILSDADFQILMEHSLWTQVRNKIHESEGVEDNAGGADIFWTDVCIPRDTIFYFSWGYRLLSSPIVSVDDHEILQSVIGGLVQVGGQANVGRGWVQSWVNDSTFVPVGNASTDADETEATTLVEV